MYCRTLTKTRMAATTASSRAARPRRCRGAQGGHHEVEGRPTGLRRGSPAEGGSTRRWGLRPQQRLDPARRPDLVVDATDVVAHGALREPETAGDADVVETLRQVAQDLRVPWRQGADHGVPRLHDSSSLRRPRCRSRQVRRWSPPGASGQVRAAPPRPPPHPAQVQPAETPRRARGRAGPPSTTRWGHRLGRTTRRPASAPRAAVHVTTAAHPGLELQLVAPVAPPGPRHETVHLIGQGLGPRGHDDDLGGESRRRRRPSLSSSRRPRRQLGRHQLQKRPDVLPVGRSRHQCVPWPAQEAGLLEQVADRRGCRRGGPGGPRRSSTAVRGGTSPPSRRVCDSRSDSERGRR